MITFIDVACLLSRIVPKLFHQLLTFGLKLVSTGKNVSVLFLVMGPIKKRSRKIFVEFVSNELFSLPFITLTKLYLSADACSSFANLTLYHELHYELSDFVLNVWRSVESSIVNREHKQGPKSNVNYVLIQSLQIINTEIDDKMQLVAWTNLSPVQNLRMLGTVAIYYK